MNQEFEQQYDEPDELPNEIMLVKESDIMRQMMTAYSDDNNPLRDKHLLVMPGEVSDYFAEIYNHLNIHYVKLQCNGFFYWIILISVSTYFASCYKKFQWTHS